MRFEETPLPGAFVVEIEKLEDERGFFARTWCRQELAARGLVAAVDQCSVSYNRRAQTLRGMHYQADPLPETKMVSCVRGRAFDVIVDLRRTSTTYLRWYGLELGANDGRAIYIPAGFAHGFLTLEDDTMLQYAITPSYRGDLARGVRWNDPAFGIRWPVADGLTMSARDRDYAPFRPDVDGFAAPEPAAP